MQMSQNKALSTNEIKIVLDQVISEWDGKHLSKFRAIKLKKLFSKKNVRIALDVCRALLFTGKSDDSGFRIFRMNLNEILHKSDPPITFYISRSNAQLKEKECFFVRIEDAPRPEHISSNKELLNEIIARLRKIENTMSESKNENLKGGISMGIIYAKEARKQLEERTKVKTSSFEEIWGAMLEEAKTHIAGWIEEFNTLVATATTGMVSIGPSTVNIVSKPIEEIIHINGWTSTKSLEQLMEIIQKTPIEKIQTVQKPFAELIAVFLFAEELRTTGGYIGIQITPEKDHMDNSYVLKITVKF